jgi:leucyl-tRNA synthetase
MSQYGTETAFRRTLPFSESAVLHELLPYLKKTLNLVDAEVLSVEEARQKEGEPEYTKSIIDASEPGAPGFEYRNG